MYIRNIQDLYTKHEFIKNKKNKNKQKTKNRNADFVIAAMSDKK